MATKYYITADLKRDANQDEKRRLPASAEIYLGRMKAVIEAENWQEAMQIGKRLIRGNLKKGVDAINFVWMPVEDAEKLGDAEIYRKIPTATWLTYYRIKAGLTQRQLAEKSDINIRLVQKYESGEYDPANMTAKSLLEISDALEIDPHCLILGEGK